MNDKHHNSQLKDKRKAISPNLNLLFEINKKNRHKYLLNLLLKKNSINRIKNNLRSDKN